MLYIKNKILHRDLKCANIFCNKDGTVKLGDLNVSKVAKMGLVYTQTGTPYYASPEVWQDKPYDNRSDIWSLGCVIYEMITLRPPFMATSMQELCNKVKKGIYPKIPSTYSRDLSTVITTLLTVSPLMRPSCEQILHMPAVEEHLTDEETKEICKDLLNTIKIPRNFRLLKQNLPASQYESDNKVEEKDEDYEEDFERDDLQNKQNSMIKSNREESPPKCKNRDRSERVRRRQKGLPPTAPPLKAPILPQTDRDKIPLEPKEPSNEVVTKEIEERRISKDGRNEQARKRRKNPKTTEAQIVEPKPHRYQMYRLKSRGQQASNMEVKRNVADIYKMRAKEVAAVENRVENELKYKYQDKVYNQNNKYLSKNYSSIISASQGEVAENGKIIIDPTKNSKILEQILCKNGVNSSKDLQKRRYHPLSENYRGVENKLSLQIANPTPQSNQYNLIGRAGSRGSNQSSLQNITPNSSRKELILSKLKENYKNAEQSNGGYYIPPSGLRKMANMNSQRSQPILGGLRNNLAKRYLSNQYSVDHGTPNGLPPKSIISQKRGDIYTTQGNSRAALKQSNSKPMSAHVPSWWG